jgi:hypothetical protein
MDGICVYCGKILSDVSQNICDLCDKRAAENKLFTGFYDTEGTPIYNGDTLEYPTIGGRTVLGVVSWDESLSQWRYGYGLAHFNLTAREPVPRKVFNRKYEEDLLKRKRQFDDRVFKPVYLGQLYEESQKINLKGELK